MSSTTADYEALGRLDAERHRQTVSYDAIKQLVGDESAEAYLNGFRSVPIQHDVYIVEVVEARATRQPYEPLTYRAGCIQCPRTLTGPEPEVLAWKTLHQDNSIAEVRAYWESH